MLQLRSANDGNPTSAIEKVGHYRLLRQRSDNDLFHGWEAHDTEKDRPCFVKVTHSSGSISAGHAQEIISRSFTLQRKLHFRKLITARRKSTFDEKVCLEFPLYSSQRWQYLRPELLWDHYRALLPQMFQLVDYLHLMGMVHCDLKIDNFLVDLSNSAPKVRLGDFDFLTNAGAKADRTIKGASEFIPPEMQFNQDIFPESDIYTFGKSLQYSLDDYLKLDGKKHGPQKEDLERLREIISSLCTEDRYRRPQALLSFAPPGLSPDSEQIERLRRELLMAYLHSRLKAAPGEIGESDQTLSRYLRTKCHIFGIPDDIVHELLTTARNSRTKAWRLCTATGRDRKNAVGHYGNMLHLSFNKGAIEALLRPANHTSAPVTDPDTIVSNALAEIAQYRNDGHFWRGVMVCEAALASSGNCPNHDAVRHAAPLVRQLGELSQRLHLHREAAKHYETFLAIEGLPAREAQEVMREYALTLIRLGDYKQVETFLREKLATIKASGDATLRLQQLLGWTLIFARKPDEAENILSETLHQTRDQQFHTIAIYTLYSLGVLRWRQGKFREAVAYLEEGALLAREHNLPSDSMSSVTMLAYLHCELGEYTKGLRYCKQFRRESNMADHYGFYPAVYRTICLAYTRLGNYTKAEYWLQQFLEIGSSDPTPKHLFMSAHTEMFVKMNAGDLISSREWAMQTLQGWNRPGLEDILGKTYHCLAEMELYCGRIETCTTYAKRASALLAESKNEAAQAELDLIQTVADRLYSGKDVRSQLDRLQETLHNKNCTYYEALALFYEFALYPSEVRPRLIALTEQFLVDHDEEKVPLFGALSALGKHYGSKTQEHTEEREIEAWKQAFLLLNQSDQRFLGLLATLRLIDLQHAANKVKQAARYALLAKDTATQLENETLKGAVELRLRNLPVTTEKGGDLITIFHSISELLRNMKDYRQTLELLLNFAVNQSGAERGILFLAVSDAAGLRPLAAVRCDELSVADATDFSKSIVEKTTEEMEPLVVENARFDPRTNKYRSIIRYNILSVIALPLIYRGRVVGVLYLDHHAIPSVFSHDDLRYVQTIANFIAQAWDTVEDLRSLRLQRDRYADESGKSDGRSVFVSADPTIEKLFAELAMVANTNMEVLLIGESGTGKELVAEEIHRLSGRSERQMVRVNSAALTSSMAEAELFGIVKGAATEVAGREGLLSHADGSTLFFDEIGDMDPAIQAKLLRAIEYQQFSPVGTNRIIRTDIRFIFATNQDLKKLMEKGQFRSDFYYRISSKSRLKIPPLRERKGDVPLLLDYFLKKLSKGTPPRFTTEAKILLERYTWPGNVRELKNIVERFCMTHPGGTIDMEMLPSDISEVASVNYDKYAEEMAKASEFKELFRRVSGNQSEMSRQLNIPLSTLRRLLKKYGVI